MNYIDPHIHMISRITDDYVRLARAGCVAVCEPAFWAGFDRGSAASFADYFRHLTEVEPRRASQFGIHHMCWLCINAKEADNIALAREVIAAIPQFLHRPGVLGIGEIGLNKNTRNEAVIFLEHVDLAARTDELLLIHTPHLADKYKGTRMIIDMLKSDARIDPQRVLIDHVEEHTIAPALDAGFWVGMTLYPTTKCSVERAVDLIERFGDEKIMVNSAGDWGISNPMSVPDFIRAAKARQLPPVRIRKIVYKNPLQFISQTRKCNFNPKSAAWVDPLDKREP